MNPESERWGRLLRGWGRCQITWQKSSTGVTDIINLPKDLNWATFYHILLVTSSFRCDAGPGYKGERYKWGTQACDANKCDKRARSACKVVEAGIACSLIRQFWL